MTKYLAFALCLAATPAFADGPTCMACYVADPPCGGPCGNADTVCAANEQCQSNGNCLPLCPDPDPTTSCAHDPHLTGGYLDWWCDPRVTAVCDDAGALHDKFCCGQLTMPDGSTIPGLVQTWDLMCVWEYESGYDR